MPRLTVRNVNDVPPPSRLTKAVRETQQQYESYVQAINGDVGELVPSNDEQLRSIKVNLRRAANRLGRDIEIWDANGNVYFRVASRRGRPKKST